MWRWALIMLSGILILCISIIELIGDKFILSPISHYIETGSEMNRISTFGPESDQRRLHLQVWKSLIGYEALLIISNKQDATPLVSVRLLDYYYPELTQRAYLNFINLDRDKDLEIFIHQPQYPEGKRRYDMITPGNYIVDYRKGEVVLRPYRNLKSYFLINYARPTLELKLILIVIALLLPVVFPFEFPKLFHIIILVSLVTLAVIILPPVWSFRLFVLLAFLWIWFAIKLVFKSSKKKVDIVENHN